MSTSASNVAERTSLAEGTSSVADTTTPAAATQAAATTATPRQSTETFTSEIPESLYSTEQKTTEVDITTAYSTQITTGEENVINK